MYPKRKLKDDVLVDIDELNDYDEKTIEKKEEEGELNPGDAGVLRGNNKGSRYEEEEEEE